MKIHKFESQHNVKVHDLSQKQQEVKNDIEFNGKIRTFAQETKKVFIANFFFEREGMYGWYMYRINRGNI